MRPNFLIALLLLFAPIIGFAGAAIPENNQVILKDISKENITPRKDETRTAMDLIYLFLEHPEKDIGKIETWTTDKDLLRAEIEKIHSNLPHYRVQFIGKVREGRRIILCNFFHDTVSSDDYWKEQPILVLDGGFWFWRVEYDPEQKRILSFASNGYA